MKIFQIIFSLFLLAGLIWLNQRFGSDSAVAFGGLSYVGLVSVLFFSFGVLFIFAARDLSKRFRIFSEAAKTAKLSANPRILSPEELRELGLSKYRGPEYPHPVIFTDRCIGCQACVDACPHDVLAIVDGVAAVVSIDQCMEDTACQVECPVNPKACIVINTTKEIVSRPSPNRDGSNYQTNVPGCFIIGDVSGVPLIKNAVKEGTEVVEFISHELKTAAIESEAEYDVAIIGVGPGGASAAMAAQEKGLRYIAIEQEKILSTIQMYPKGKYIFFKPDTKDWFGELPVAGLGLAKGKYDSQKPLSEGDSIDLGKDFDKIIAGEIDAIKKVFSNEIPVSLHAEFLPLLSEKSKDELNSRLKKFISKEGLENLKSDQTRILAQIRDEIIEDLQTKIPGDQRERILSVWMSGLNEKGVKINEEESCKSVKRADNGDYFVIDTEQGTLKQPQTYKARRVVLAIGLRGAPNKLRLPNEDLKLTINGNEENKVLYALSNPNDYSAKHLIVVGGGNSAVEAAVDLVARRDGSEITPRAPDEINKVTLLVRDYLAPSVKFGNKYQLYQMLDRGILDVKFGVSIKEMSETEVVLADAKTGNEVETIPNDYIFALIGGERPDRFLKSVGIEIS